MAEKGRMADKGGARETSVPIAKKKKKIYIYIYIYMLYLNKEQVRETRGHMAQCCPRSERKLREETRDFDNGTDAIGGWGIIKDRIIKIGGYKQQVREVEL